MLALESNACVRRHLQAPVELELPRNNRTWINWMRSGDASKQKLLFIHGYPDSLFTWKKMFGPAPSLQEQQPDTDLLHYFELFALDLPGHGYTRTLFPLAEDDLEPQQAADFVIKFMDAIDLDRVIIVGNSFGGLVACHMALRYPNRVDGLVLLDCEGVPRSEREHLKSEKLLRHWFTGPFSAWFSVATFFARVSHLKLGSARAWEAEVNEAIKELSTIPYAPSSDEQQEYALLMRTDGNYRTNHSLTRRKRDLDWPYWETLGKIFNNPVLLIWGEQDNLFPAKCVIGGKLRTNHCAQFIHWFGTWTSPSAPRSFSYVAIGSAAHRPQLEAPNQVIKSIVRVFGRL